MGTNAESNVGVGGLPGRDHCEAVERLGVIAHPYGGLRPPHRPRRDESRRGLSRRAVPLRGEVGVTVPGVAVEVGQRLRAPLEHDIPYHPPVARASTLSLYPEVV